MSDSQPTVSHWWDEVGVPDLEPPARGNITADVCIVGAGFTGLWTALYLHDANPSLKIVLLDSHFAGFGASGRNGGWLTNSITGGREQYIHEFGRELTVAFQAAMTASVYEVLDQMTRLGIDADAVVGGELNVATNAAQHQRLLSTLKHEENWGGDVSYLDTSSLASRISVPGAISGILQPHCARIHPAKLSAGLRRAVLERSIELYENSAVSEISPRVVTGTDFTVSATYIVRATEGFTADFHQYHRDWLPMNSTLIVTEPLPQKFWSQVGWQNRETLGDMAHVYMYAQRTADDRIALGGRGVPYRYGSQTNSAGTTSQRTRDSLVRTLQRMFPAISTSSIERTWSGVLGVPRDWAATVGLNRTTGIGWAGGYVGTGVTATNLAARTLRDLILEHDSELCQLPWVNHQVRKWEPEPLRWIATTGLYSTFRAADRHESRSMSNRTAVIAQIANRLAGRH